MEFPRIGTVIGHGYNESRSSTHLALRMPSHIEVCLEAAQRGGQALLDWQDRFSPREKGPKDLVSEADLAAQETIRTVIRKAFPGHDFLSEEDAADRHSKG